MNAETGSNSFKQLELFLLTILKSFRHLKKEGYKINPKQNNSCQVTKYINGHTDVCMGVISTRDEDLAKRLRFLQLGQYLINFRIV